MSCPQCGAETPQNATRCGSCGARLGAAPAPAETPAVPAAAEVSAGNVTPAGDVPSHMPIALIATIASVACCCLPFGVIAIIPASMVAGRVEQGNISGARTMSGLALGWSILTLLVSLGSVSACMASSFSAVGMVRSVLGV